LGDQKDIDVTHGVNISDLTIKGENGDTIFKTFDFAGQRVYHSLHPFFMLKKSIFIITYNLRYGPLNLEYWLYSVKSRSPNSSIIIVATHSDLVDEDSVPNSLKEKFPQIKDIIKVSNKNGDGISNLIRR
jgi:internalin A